MVYYNTYHGQLVRPHRSLPIIEAPSNRRVRLRPGALVNPLDSRCAATTSHSTMAVYTSTAIVGGFFMYGQLIRPLYISVVVSHLLSPLFAETTIECDNSSRHVIEASVSLA